MPAYKVILKSHVNQLLENGFVPDQAADVGCAFIHACDADSVDLIIDKFFKGKETSIVKLDVETVARRGFVIKYETNREGGPMYWHFYRPVDGRPVLIPLDCIQYVV